MLKYIKNNKKWSKDEKNNCKEHRYDGYKIGNYLKKFMNIQAEDCRNVEVFKR